MLLSIIKQQLLLLSAKGFKAPRLIPIVTLSLILSLGAAAGHSALIQDFELGHHDQDGAARDVKPAPIIVRGMKQMPVLSNEAKPIARILARILDSEDEKTYRELFAALNDGNIKDAERLAGEVKEGTLLGTAQAMFLLHPRNTNVKPAELAEWLKTYGTLSQAQDVYKKALSLRVAGDVAPLAPPVVKSTAVTAPKPTMAEPLDWKKPRNFAADAAWHAGKFDDVLEKIGDVDVADNAPDESYYPLWIKGLAAYAVEDYANAAHSFMSVAKSNLPSANRAAAAYWAARSFEKTFQNEQATLYYEQAAAVPQSYYGMLALAHKASTDSAVLDVWHEPSLSSHHISLLKQDAAGLRALALLQIGEKDLALKELQAISDKPALQDALAALSDAAELPMVVTPRNGKQASRFPMLQWRPAGGFISDPALVMAIAWNESRFEVHAQNPSGARGIMQMMPDTAERITAGSSGSLFNAQANVTLGDLYIHKLSAMNGIDGNLVLLIAGYNCGPGKVQQLFAEAQQHSAAGKDPLLFIETMPLKETRDYVQKVLATYAAYRLRLGKPLSSMASLSRGEWPAYETTRTASK